MIRMNIQYAHEFLYSHPASILLKSSSTHLQHHTHVHVTLAAITPEGKVQSITKLWERPGRTKEEALAPNRTIEQPFELAEGEDPQNDKVNNTVVVTKIPDGSKESGGKKTHEDIKKDLLTLMSTVGKVKKINMTANSNCLLCSVLKLELER